MRLARWTHPRTGEVRVYVNGLTGFDPRGRIWMVAEEFVPGHMLVEIRATGYIHDPRQTEQRIGLAVRNFTGISNLGSRGAWPRILELAN